MQPATFSMETFLALSAELTGFTVFDLRGTGEAQAYLDTATGVVGTAVVADLLGVYGKLGGTKDEREKLIRQRILGDPKLGPVTRCLIKLWFTGVWYQLPPAWIAAYGPLKANDTFAVRPSSYAEGLLWKTIGANPPGARAPGYGSWAEPPRIPDPAGDFSVLSLRIV